jgi:hypothetical protein
MFERLEASKHPNGKRRQEQAVVPMKQMKAREGHRVGKGQQRDEGRTQGMVRGDKKPLQLITKRHGPYRWMCCKYVVTAQPR